MKHFMKLMPKPFYMMKSGDKTIELRLNDEKRQKININDEIEFTQTENGEKLNVRVVKIYKFSSFEELYKSLPLYKSGYTAKEAETARAADMEKYYSKEREIKYGVLGIEIKLV